MARVLSTMCSLPAKILWKIALYLNDESMLPFLTTCYHVLSAVEEKDIDWRRWFFCRFNDDIETHNWIEWHNMVLEQEKSASAHNTDNVQNDYQHNSNWLRHCIAQFDLAKNWQHGIDACNMLNISENSSIEDNTQTASRILASNVWGTLILTEANILYFAAHWPKPKLTFIANVSGSFSDQSYNLIKGVLNKRFIVLAGPGRPANNSGVANGCVLYWDQTQPRPIESKQLLYNHGATEIVDLRDQWLLLKKPTVSTESYSINILNLQQRVPIPVKSEAHWNTYSIFGTSNTTCKVYAGALNTNTQHQFASHSWDMLQSGVLDLRTVDEQRNIALPLRVSKYGARQSRFLTSNLIMVWQMALSMQPKHIENSTTHNAANDCMVFGKPKSILTLNNNIKYTDQQESVFFIHDIYSTEVHYSGTFVNELPAVSIKKHRIIILNGTNLKLVDMGSKQTVFSTTVARDLVHVGFTLGQFWIAQHPSGGFYTINLDDTSKFGWIPAKDASGEARASTNALVKVAGNNTAIWIMNKIV